MDILDDMGMSKLSAKVLLKVNYSLNVGNVLQKSLYVNYHSNACTSA